MSFRKPSGSRRDRHVEFITVNDYIIRWSKSVSGEAPHLCILYKSEGKWRTTGAIRHHARRRIWTFDGDRFYLGLPHPLFVAWAAKNSYEFDPNYPFDFDLRGKKFIPVVGSDGSPEQTLSPPEPKP